MRDELDELLEELGWSWLPPALVFGWVVVYFVVGWMDKWS